MAYKGTLGTPVNIVGRPKNKTTKSCRNCKYYMDKWCEAFKITCSSITNAKHCKKYKNKYGAHQETNKRVRCSTCEFICYDTAQSGKSTKKLHWIYRCSKREQQIAYNKVGVCKQYQKKKEQSASVSEVKLYKKDSDEYNQRMAEMKRIRKKIKSQQQ